ERIGAAAEQGDLILGPAGGDLQQEQVAQFLGRGVCGHGASYRAARASASASSGLVVCAVDLPARSRAACSAKLMPPASAEKIAFGPSVSGWRSSPAPNSSGVSPDSAKSRAAITAAVCLGSMPWATNCSAKARWLAWVVAWAALRSALSRWAS